MTDSVTRVRELAHQLGITIPEDRLPSVAELVESALQEVEQARPKENPMPAPSAYDASWETN